MEDKNRRLKGLLAGSAIENDPLKRIAPVKSLTPRGGEEVLDSPQLKPFEAELSAFLVLPPRTRSVASATMATSAIIRAYSTNPCPRSSLRHAHTLRR